MISIYVHWPFCLSKCPYCDFNSHVANSFDHSLWLDAYNKELDFFEQQISGKYVKSIFFGGGTPSLMSPATIAGIIEKISKLAAIIDNKTEITLEANPTSFELEKFKSFALAGINRLSLGIQALREQDLIKLGREHDVKTALKAAWHASTIFPRFSFDLIYTRSGQTLKAWQNELEEAMQLAAGHLSLYQLTIEKGTPFYNLSRDGKLVLPDQDVAADMYEWTGDFMNANGYNRYEISNYARTSHECLHNLTYWQYHSYIGIGPGAHSRLISDNKARAIMMWHKPEKWLNTVFEKGNAIQLDKNLTDIEILEEFLMMGLRLRSGISQESLTKIAHYKISDILSQHTVQTYINMGLLHASENNLQLTDKGLALHSYLVPRLLELLQKSCIRE